MKKILILFLALLAITFFSTVQAKMQVQFDLNRTGIVSNPFKTNLKAKDFCKMDENINYIADYNQETGEYDFYYCESAPLEKSTNFKIVPNKGYFVSPVSGESVTIRFEGNKIIKTNKTIIQGWNLIGFPQTLAHDYTAEDICSGVLPIDNYTPLTVYTYTEGGGYVGGNCGSELFDNFNVEAGRGYWVIVKAN